MSNPIISVVIPTRNPDRSRLGEVLAALGQQSLSTDAWELCLVDNGSVPQLRPEDLGEYPANRRVVTEPRAGLLWARLCGLRETRGEYVVFIDDDTVPDTNFLQAAVSFMSGRPRVATAGGIISGRFAVLKPAWIECALWCLALRDNGGDPLEWALGEGEFPSWTPIGAGLLTRRAALEPGYVAHVANNWQAIETNSWVGQGAGGVEDKDLVLHCLRAGWSTGYAPEMKLTHLIPASRLERSYIERLIPKLERIWMRTLHAHALDEYPPIHPLTLWLRQTKAWFVMRAWSSPSARISWLSSCGRLRGLADNYQNPARYAVPTKR